MSQTATGRSNSLAPRHIVRDVVAAPYRLGRRLRRRGAPEAAESQDTPGVSVIQIILMSMRYLRPYPWPVAEILFYIIFSVAYSVGMTKMQQQLFDKALPGFGRPGDNDALLVLVVILATGGGLVLLMSLRRSYVMASVSGRVLMDLRMSVFSNLQRTHLGFFQTMRPGDISSRMTNDLSQIEFALVGLLAQGLSIVLTLIAATIMAFVLDWRLALLIVAGTPLFFVSSRWLGPAAAAAGLQRQRDVGVVTSALHENLAAQPVVKAFGLEDQTITTFRGGLNQLFRSSIRLTFVSSLFGVAAESVTVLLDLTLLGLGGWLVLQGELSIGTLLALLALKSLILRPTQNMSVLLQSLYRMAGAMERVDELIQATPIVTDAPGARPLKRLERELRMEGVKFAYNDEATVLQGIDMSIPAGSYVAIVGPSGCGKSTLLSMLLRFNDPQDGRILFDGIDISEGTMESLRKQVGIVFQDDFLFHTSILENIRMGDPSAGDEAVYAAAKAAEIHDVILSMPNGYETRVGERGSRLSGGQRQRIAIARALIRQPALLLLDEASSALDARTEASIMKTLERLAGTRTVISVTHRLSSATNADRIFVLDEGTVVEQGTHDDLLRRRGLYARLWRDQRQKAWTEAAGPPPDTKPRHPRPV